jgi:hypothetical protein
LLAKARHLGQLLLGQPLLLSDRPCLKVSG